MSGSPVVFLGVKNSQRKTRMHLTMNTKERERFKAIHRIENNELTIANAARSLSVNKRQIYRILSRYHSEGDAGIIHKLRGKVSPHRTELHIRKQVVDAFDKRWRTSTQDDYLFHSINPLGYNSKNQFLVRRIEILDDISIKH